MANPRLTVVVPTLDEEARLGHLLDDLVARVDEVVVADGGSRDATVAVARARGARVVVSPRGRGVQLHAGACAASGEVLWFVHADARLPAGVERRVIDTLRRDGVVAGAFRTRTLLDRGDRRWFTPVLPLADLRPRYTRLPYGDQALFCWAWAYRVCGGYPPQPLLEDVELARRLRRVGAIVTLPDAVAVSARRWAAHPLRTALVMNTFPTLARLGVPLSTLARWYGHPR